MNKVVTIHLNGRAYQLEEQGFEALRVYLDEASARLASDPGRTEIVADLEQAIAEKCDKVLNPHKSVVLNDEVQKIIAEMGPVQGDPQKEAHEQAASGGARAPKRLFLMRQGAVIAGVCAGLATYFDIDVTIVRIIFIAGTVLTSGLGILIYIALAVLVPYADTAEAMAQAHGEPLNAHTLAQRAKERFHESYERVTGQKPDWNTWQDKHDQHIQEHWKKRWMKKQWKMQQKVNPPYAPYYHPSPIFGLLRGALAIAWILALLSLLTTGLIFGWAIPAGIPIWVAVILLFIIYHAVTGPLKGAQYMHGYYGYSDWDGLVDGLTVLFLIIAFIWAYQHVPQVYDFVHHPIAESKMYIADIEAWWQQGR
ncbi:MAG TPA: PspC domain-containing protein [Candidatus Paceibacterota bacterium]|nr:PspC domain-containing protein [Candidatus Paceibacterota bacterium]